MVLGEREAGNGISATRIADAVDEQRIDCPEQVIDGGSQIGAVEQFNETDKEVIRKGGNSNRQVRGTTRSILGK
jgi:hypothetical protein